MVRNSGLRPMLWNFDFVVEYIILQQGRIHVIWDLTLKKVGGGLFKKKCKIVNNKLGTKVKVYVE
jgi:hypothetical protein